MGHTGIYACGDYVRRNLGATVAETRIPPALAVGSVNEQTGQITQGIAEKYLPQGQPSLKALPNAKMNQLPPADR